MSIRRPYDCEHYVEMIYCSLEEDRKTYYPDGSVKRCMQVEFCKEANEYYLKEYNYQPDGRLVTEDSGFAIRRIYNTHTVAVYGTYVDGRFTQTGVRDTMAK